jgi:hypothetical protein
VFKRAAHTAAISAALAAAALFYLGAPTVYAYFSEVRLSYARGPAWIIRTLPARATTRIFAEYNHDSPLAARFRVRASCTLADDGARRMPGCAHEIRAGGRVSGPAALKLSPGVYLARFAFSEAESCTDGGEARLEVTATGRFGKLLAGYGGRIIPPERVDVPFTVKPIDAGFSDIQFAARGSAGCIVLRRLDLEELAQSSY